jgi:mono/diheme cytochrome c family protein
MAGSLLQAAIPRSSLPGPVDEGAWLMGELNCTACHESGADAGRLASRGAPNLGVDPLQTSTAWLRKWITAPHVSKPGTAMPDVLHGLDNARRAEVADNITHYLASLRSANSGPALGADASRIEQGRKLYHSVGCVACHAPESKPSETSEEVFDKAKLGAIPLGDLSRKYPAAELVRFLRDPLAHRPGGRMPSLNLSSSEAEAIATYLLREQVPALNDPSKAPPLIGGLRYEYYEAGVNNIAALLGNTPKSSGDATALDINSFPHPDNGWGVRFSGYIEIPADGEYRFWLNSDDGSRLSIDGAVVVDNDGDHAPVEKTGKVTLKRGPHPLEVVFFQGAGGAEFTATWRPPGGKRGPIPPDVFKRVGQPLIPLDSETFALDISKAAAGRKQFSDMNCSACHAVMDSAGAVLKKAARPLAELASRSTAGCLAEKPPASAPRFDLSAEQRAAITKTLASAANLDKPLSPAEQISWTMSRLNCFACHSRDAVGGPVATGRTDWFAVVGEADLGDEGRIPPHLDGVGAKLKEGALLDIVSKGTKARPYMATRMPVFGPEAVKLAALFKQADRRADAQPPPTFTSQDAKGGWKLVGRDGLSCVSCHTFTTFGSLGIPALAIDKMGERLEWDWLRRYLPDPAALRPGTRMPSFWPEGHAVNTAILNGDTAAQLRAIYAYISEGAKAEVPAGLVRGRKELIVGDEALIYRNFIEGAGPRAIGIGYPEHANLAFDAQNLRLAWVWQGSFIDASRHSTDRGVGYEPPLGDHRIHLPDGPSFAAISEGGAAWPTLEESGGKFLGYRLDPKQRPTFRYRFGTVQIEETPQPKPGPVDMTLLRTFRFEGPSSSLWFRAARGKIRQDGDSWIVDDQLRLKFRNAGTPVIAGDELRVQVNTSKDFVVEMTW